MYTAVATYYSFLDDCLLSCLDWNKLIFLSTITCGPLNILHYNKYLKQKVGPVAQSV